MGRGGTGTAHKLAALVAITIAAVLTPQPSPASASGVIVTAIGAARTHVCAVTDTGGLKCWGSNGSGQLGDGSLFIRSVPVDVVGLDSGVAAVDPGWNHTCAVTTEGGAKCWGWNIFGQLGVTGVECVLPNGGSIACSNVPVDVEGLESGVAAVSGGNFHTCALTTAGGVQCWGNNSVGQLGDGTTTSRFTPADVPGLTSGVAAVIAGFDHTCALTTAGGVKCWGDNIVNALGAESSETCISAFGDPHACSTTPLDVETLDSGVTALSARATHTCALTQAGGVRCWGNNVNGQLGDGTFGNNRRTPEDVLAAPGGPPLTGVAALAAGGQHTCALTTAGGVKCWGSNLLGTVGDGDTNPKERPIPVDVCQFYDAGAQQCAELFAGATAVTAGLAHSCALTTVGGVKCWGTNCCGNLGIGTLDGQPHPVPVDVVGLGPKPTPTPTATQTPAAPAGTPTATETAPSPPAATPTPTAANSVTLPRTGISGGGRGSVAPWAVAALAGAGAAAAGYAALRLRRHQVR